jgi:hypothetical protein
LAEYYAGAKAGAKATVRAGPTGHTIVKIATTVTFLVLNLRKVASNLSLLLSSEDSASYGDLQLGQLT